MNFDPLCADPQIDDPAFPPSGYALTIPSGGCDLYGVLYRPRGQGLHPTVLMLHGFPGTEKNLDLAQIFRRAGFNAVVFSYRGAWGSQGSFSFSHVIEDSRAALAFLLEEFSELEYAVDRNRIILFGHSMGGFAALKAAETAPSVSDVLFIAGWNIGLDGIRSSQDPEAAEKLEALLGGGAGVLAGTSVDALLNEIEERGEAFDLRNSVSSLEGKHLLLVGGSKDTVTPLRYHHEPLLEALQKGRDIQTEEAVIHDDHSFSASRIALARLLLQFLHKRGY